MRSLRVIQGVADLESPLAGMTRNFVRKTKKYERLFSNLQNLCNLRTPVLDEEAIMETFLRDLLDHAEWANAVFFNAWANSPASDHEELRSRVGHIVGVQHGFLSILHGEQPSGPPGGPPPTYEDLKASAESVHAGLRAFAATLDSEGLTRKVHVPWFPDPPCNITIAEALVQVAMHSQHHRGQCMTRLKDFGGEAKNVDWIIWLWKQKPEARWS